MSIEASRLVGRYAAEGDVEMLRWLHKSGEVDLSVKTEMGTTCAYLAVLNDRPDILRLLFELGIDLTKPCDAMDYGSPALWAAKYGREHVLVELFNLGIDLNKTPCEKYGKSAFFMANVFGNHPAMERVEQLQARRNEAATTIAALARGHRTRQKARDHVKQFGASQSIQRLMRGEVARIRLSPRMQGRLLRWAKKPVGERVKERKRASIIIEALVRGGVVRLKLR